MTLLGCAQIALAAGADLAFALAVGAVVLSLGGPARWHVSTSALLAWLVLQAIYLPLQTSAMIDVPFITALDLMPKVLNLSHYGEMWRIGYAAGLAAWLIAAVAARTRLPDMIGNLLIVTALAAMAYAHAGTSHAADSGNFSAAELVQTVHLLAISVWVGIVIAAAWPLRRAFAATPDRAAGDTSRLSHLATLSFPVALGTGIANAYWGLGGSLASLTSGLWGWLLCVKVIAVVGILMIAALNRLRYLQHVWRGDPDALTVFRRLLGVEAWLMIGVVIIAAALAHTMPPAMV